MARWLRCPLEPRPASSAHASKDGRPSDKRRFERGQPPAPCTARATELGPASLARLPLRVAPDVEVRVATETVGGRKIAHNLLNPGRIVSARHAARPPCAQPSASILDFALPHYRTAPARIPVTKRVAWYPTAHARTTSDTNGCPRPEIEPWHEATVNQQSKTNCVG